MTSEFPFRNITKTKQPHGGCLEWEEIGVRDLGKEFSEIVPSKNHLNPDFDISNGNTEESTSYQECRHELEAEI